METVKIDSQWLSLFSNDFANYYKIIPVSATDDRIDLLTYEHSLVNTFKEEIEFYLGKTIQFDFIAENELLDLLSIHYKKTLASVLQDKILEIDDVKFLENLIEEAKKMNSSDIHFEVFENTARIRFRIDGVLIEKHQVLKENYLELVNKIKIKANLDITEKRLPQDGRIKAKDFDIRVSILPTLYGEKIVMRILGKDASHIGIDKVGFTVQEQCLYLETVKKENGIVLISGPTGSGKTTTLYATLKALNNSQKNIVTVEDPIEYTLEGINQVQLRENIGLTFTGALRAFLRQDPDIIMLGEIRDVQTAQMAIRASLTGHLVLSTIHTNSALGTISRLIDMGIPPFLIAETLNISVAQRLLRKLCNHCKESVALNPLDLPLDFSFKEIISSHYVAKGCNECYYTGYKGRTAIYEMIPIDVSIATKIKNNSLDNQNLPDGFTSLADKAIELFKNGITSLEEIYAILITE